jgi:hypothetical protein
MTRKVKNATVTAEAVESTPFTLDLPLELEITPAWIVQVSPTKSAFVYKYTVPGNNHEPDTHDEYEVRIANTKTRVGNSNDYYSRQNFRHLHEVKHSIINASHNLNIKKKTRRTVEVDEVDEE